jgi:hypothetical protein
VYMVLVVVVSDVVLFSTLVIDDVVGWVVVVMVSVR